MLGVGAALPWGWEDPPRAAAAAAKSLQLCPTLCDPIDSSPAGPAVPGILQARLSEGRGDDSTVEAVEEGKSRETQSNDFAFTWAHG